MSTKSVSWPRLKKFLLKLKPQDQSELMRKLYDLNSPNRELMLQACGLSQGEGLHEECTEKIRKAFDRKLNLLASRAAIDEYMKTTRDPVGTAKLLLVHVEAGIQYARFKGQIPNIDKTLSNSLVAAAREACRLIRSQDARAIQQVLEIIESTRSIIDELDGPLLATLDQLSEDLETLLQQKD